MNVEIVAAPPDSNEQPAGRRVLNELVALLQGGGWEPRSEPDNWRDSGWSVELANGAELILSHVEDSKYWIQIVPTNPPSRLKSLFKRDAYAEADAIVSRCSEALARELEAHSDIQARTWNWDGPPSEGPPKPEFRH
jgi:hypothetical protein